ncbi:MAG: hypothetical protein EOO04_30260 [Chitinophagaceae bacterium]|nr:MAG: hypothetical protein EOO04_30260 [Chitinophagaceae bacterium]
MEDKKYQNDRDDSSVNAENKDSDKGTVPTPKAAGIVEEHIKNIKPESNRKENNDKPDNEQYPHK